MRGSRATLAQMAEAADLVADPQRQPVFFHCVAGHHRSSLVHAAYLIRHRGYTAREAWDVVAALPWARPGDDGADRRLIEAFAATPNVGS
jgi:protein-tyrosine phosphatase